MSKHILRECKRKKMWICFIAILVQLFLVIWVISKDNNSSRVLVNKVFPNSISNTRNVIPRNDLKTNSLNFSIFYNYSSSIKEYFSNCNASSTYGQHWKNQYTHLGETYFSYNNLKTHKWYNPNISDTNLIILPIFISMAMHGQCDQLMDKKLKFKQAHQIIIQFFDELLHFVNTNSIKITTKYLWEAQWKNMAGYKNKKMKQFMKRYPNLIIGGYEYMRDSFWKHANFIVTPYTTPFKYNDYKIYDDLEYKSRMFHKKKYSLFYMGSVCIAADIWPHSMRHRAIAINIMDQLNKQYGGNEKHFGIMTDYNDLNHSRCLKQGVVPDALRKCRLIDENNEFSLESLPCGLDQSNLFQNGDENINENNELYEYGLKNSKYNLMIHGDTPTSGKFFDAIAFGLINIMIGINTENMRAYLPFTDIIPYKDFVFFISKKDFEKNGLNILLRILYDTPHSKIEYMISNMTLRSPKYKLII